ncbi:MAG: CDP-diacylglycerol--glycerol-3-phosphate 3-phosphatidyltransferase [Planctomycetota bacterium]
MSAANLLTASRLVLTLPIIVLMYAGRPWAVWTAFGVFLAAMVTDIFDGMLARRDPSRSTLGNYLDPIADKVLLTCVFICLAHLGILPVWMALVLVVREFVVNGVRSAGAVQGKVVGANWMGKTKTFLQTVAISFALCGRAVAASASPGAGPPPFAGLCMTVAWWVAFVVTIAAAVFACVFVYWNRALWRARNAR